MRTLTRTLTVITLLALLGLAQAEPVTGTEPKPVPGLTASVPSR